MFASLSIRLRLSIALAFLLALSSALLVWFKISDMRELVGASEKRELAAFSRQIQQQIAAEERLAVTLADFVARLPDVRARLRAEDRDGLQAALEEAFNHLRDERGLRQLQFHQPPAMSWLRVHKAEKFGDDLSSFRHTVVMTNAERRAVSGVEAGVAGLGIRGVVPVVLDGQHWGSVEFGFSLGQPFFDAFRDLTGVDVNLYRVTESGAGLERFAGTLGQQPLLNAAELQNTLDDGSAHYGIASLNDTSYAIYLDTLRDYSGSAMGVFEIAMNRAEYSAAIAASLRSSLLLAAVTIIIGIAVALWITLSITRPITDMRMAMQEISDGDGDLTRRLPEVGGRELRAMAAAFNQFVARIETLINRSIASIAEVSMAGNELFDKSNETRDTIALQKARTDEVAAAVNEMTTTAGVVASGAEEAAEKCQSSGERSQTGFAELESSIISINDLATDVSESVNLINEVNTQSGKISGILDVIRAIAEQTNLLALNAAIEAARAGEQGRGFAVVADEVRSLAARTQNSTTEINDMISQLQAGIQKAVARIQASREQVESTVTKARSSGEALREIHTLVEAINDSMTQIASTAEEQSQVAETINQSVHEIADGAQAVSDQSTGIMTASSQVGVELYQLLSIVKGFKTSRDTATELAMARAAHIAWKMRLRHFIDGHSGLDANQATSDHECDFGRWYYAPEREHLRQDSDLRSIEGPHRRMHELIREIIEEQRKGRSREVEQKYQEVCELSATIVAGLDRAARRHAVRKVA